MSTPRDLLAGARFRWLKPLRTSSSRPTLPVVAAPEKRAALRAARLKEVARGGSNHSTLWMECFFLGFFIGAITISGVRIYAITIHLFRTMPLQFV